MKRNCLKCKESFESESAYNRLCSTCNRENKRDTTSGRYRVRIKVGKENRIL